MGDRTRLLFVEDDENDVLLLLREMKKNGVGEVDWKRVETADDFRTAIETEGPWDAILADYVLPAFDAVSALELFKTLETDIPFIVISGKVGEDVVVETMKAGAHDYILKDNLMRLGAALKREIRESKRRQRHRETRMALSDTEDKFRTIFNFIVDPVFVHQYPSAGSLGGFIEVNDAACEMYGYAREEFLRMAPSDINTPGLEEISMKIYEDLETRGRSLAEAAHRTRDGKTIPVELHINRCKLSGRDAMVTIARNITDKKAYESKILESATASQKAMESTIMTLARVIELRDPYTAGHQDKVSLAAAAIARELGFDDQQIRGIEVAGMIHDIGKITVPGDILSKPSKLSATEFELMKQTPAAAAGILQGVEFPWPIREIIGQHYEWLDGSGYPDGLSGDEIMPEARVLAVANVLDALSSHRPYRPAYKQEEALGILEKEKGAHLDPEAVDACIRLVREGLIEP